MALPVKGNLLVLLASIALASGFCISVSTADPPASAPSVFVLANFEMDGPNFVKGDGQVVTRQDKKVYEIAGDKTAYRKLYIDDRAPLAEAKNRHWLKADLFNPGDAPVAYNIKVEDTASRDSRTRFDKEGSAPPGSSKLVLDLTSLPKNSGAGDLDRAKLRQISIFLSPGQQGLSLCFSNLRMEGSPDDRQADRVLYDFEKESDVASWKPAQAVENGKDPDAKVEWSTEGATSGKHAMKITFDGGQFPAVEAAVPDADWASFASVKVDITVGRPCVVGIRVQSEKGAMDKTEFLQAGKNTLATLLKPVWGKVPPPLGGKVVAWYVYLYAPHKGESILVDNIRLSADRNIPHDDNYGVFPDKFAGFKVLGTDMTVANLDDLANKLRDKWARQESKTLDEVEAAFKATYEGLKKNHPKAVLGVFRDGQKAFDPKSPDKAFDGWKDAHVNGHGPDSALQGRAANTGKEERTELFMRHRSRMMQMDLSSIPKGSNILAAQMIVICNREKPATQLSAGQHADTVAKPTMWVAEACNRPWEEQEVNAYQYAKDKFWKAISGTYYGQDPDFFPLYLAHGPAQGTVSGWDFTEAVRYWTDGAHENHGFFWHTTSEDYLSSPTREAKNVKDRPALMVIYEPKE